jgi:hypothetical protein
MICQECDSTWVGDDVSATWIGTNAIETDGRDIRVVLGELGLDGDWDQLDFEDSDR